MGFGGPRRPKGCQDSTREEWSRVHGGHSHTHTHYLGRYTTLSLTSYNLSLLISCLSLSLTSVSKSRVRLPPHARNAVATRPSSWQCRGMKIDIHCSRFPEAFIFIFPQLHNFPQYLERKKKPSTWLAGGQGALPEIIASTDTLISESCPSITLGGVGSLGFAIARHNSGHL
ncbi:hypothetical protein LZ32DRAFT_307903 [Colletotrichum eremochloae]|nr:hypothetical protein LZ32DRAFT_307903 [Colletotrichum eremochloae]